ncbi:MAG: hypothetical protein RL024_1069 [Actinomycetota bacterium]
MGLLDDVKRFFKKTSAVTVKEAGILADEAGKAATKAAEDARKAGTKFAAEALTEVEKAAKAVAKGASTALL